MQNFKQVIKWMDDLKLDMGSFHISLLSVAQSTMIVVLILIISIWIAYLIERKVNKVSRFDGNTKTIINRASKLLIMVFASLMILPIIGINLAALSVVGGAVGVGIGFGLQKIASNFISGFIILLDRSIKVGDRLIIGDQTGDVIKITARYVVLNASNGAKVIVPNEKFISDTIINQSYSNTSILLELPIGVAYGTDLRLALKLMLDAANSAPNLSTKHAATSAIKSFGDSSINLSLYVWLKDPRNGTLSSRTEIYLNMVDLLNQNNIEIPFPRQDIKILE